MIEKRYDYKIFRQGQFLGLLPNVTSEFSYTQQINTGSVDINIDVDQSLDTAHETVEPLQAEDGSEIQTEDGQTITTERSAELIGQKGSGALIANDNDIQVWEYSDDNPNGVLVFAGYISNWDGDVAVGKISLTAISYGEDLDDYIFGNDAFTTQVNQNSIYTYIDIGRAGQPYGGSAISGKILDAMAQTISGHSFELSKISIHAAAGNQILGVFPTSVNVTLKFFIGDPRGSNTLLDTVTVAVTNQAPNYQDIGFILNAPIQLDSVTQYFFSIEPDDYLELGDGYPNPYSGGHLYIKASGWSSQFVNAPDDDLVFALYSGTILTNASFTATDVADMVRQAIDGYRSQGGNVSYTVDSIDDTGVVVDYDFIMSTPQEILNKCRELAGEGWYWSVDPGTQVLTFKQTSTTPDHTFTLGKHINDLRIAATIEENVNVVYFTGGPTAGINLLRKYTDSDSLETDRVGMERLNDPQVVAANEPSARKLAENLMEENRGERFKAPLVSILASKYDISTIHDGEAVGFNGFNSFVEELVLQINSLRRDEDMVTLTLGRLPVGINDQVDSTRRDVITQQTLDNPDSPG